MGCAGSKLDDLQAVALCRARSQCLADAIRLRYALADAHLSYVRALRAVGDSLHGFVDGRGLLPPPSHVLPLPTQRKGDPMPPLSPVPTPPRAAAAASVAAPAAAPVHHLSRSNSGSHLQFHSSGSEYSDDDDGPLHSGHSSPLHHLGDPAGMGYMAGGGGQMTAGMGYMGPTTYINYAKKGAPAPAVSYQQPAMNPEVVQIGDPSYYGYSYPRQDANYDPNPYPYPYPPPYSGYGGMSSFFGASSPPPAMAMPPPPSVSPSATKPPPPPPSPPPASTWDFLNPFELSYDGYYPSYTPSRSSNVVREEEGIPELEEEEGEIIKEAYGDQKFAAPAASAVNVEDGRRSIGEKPPYQARTSGAGGEGGDREYEVNLVEKNVVTDAAQKQQPEDMINRKVVPQSRVASEAVQEIRALFHKASESCDVVSRMLEVGKLPYQRKNYEVVSSKMKSAIVPPVSMSSTFAENEGSVLVFNEEKAMKSGNLSSTLQKLYIWEKKLYEEVMAEEKMRVLHERKCKRLKYLDERGAEAYKIASTQALVKKLSTKIKIAIQVIDSISDKINTLRDEELWPQINELIQGFTKMWRAMMECHRSQCEAIIGSKNLDAVVSGGKLNDAHSEATKQLELSLLSWIDTFCSWFNAQKNFAIALNAWFLKCTIVVEEETADGAAPFSPGRLGAPTVFVICNQWLQAMDTTSDREVVAAMRAFAARVLQLWDQQKLAERQRMMANRDMDRRLKAQEREEQVIHRAVDALNKKLVLVSDSYGSMVHQIEANSLQEGLKEVFDSMERFTEASVKIYEGLLVRCEEESVSSENKNVS